MTVHRVLHDNLLASAERVSSKPIVVADDGEFTHAGMRDAALALAAGLHDLGVRRGDRVVLFMENTLACATAVFGTWFAGGVIVPVNAQTKADKLAAIVDDCSPAVLIAEGSLLRVGTDALASSDSKPRLVGAHVATTAGNRAATSFDDLLACEPLPERPATIPVDLAALIYTSGTTGVPKGVMHTHESLQFALESIVEYLRLGSDERMLSVLR